MRRSRALTQRASRTSRDENARARDDATVTPGARAGADRRGDPDRRGVPSAGLLAVTGYGTRRPRLIGLITVVERDGRRACRVYGRSEELQDLDAAAAALVEKRS
jgi:hypothetical protein